MKYDEIILDHVIRIKDRDNRYAFKNIERHHTLTKYKPKCYFQGKRLRIGERGVIATINKPIKGNKYDTRNINLVFSSLEEAKEFYLNERRFNSDITVRWDGKLTSL